MYSPSSSDQVLENVFVKVGMAQASQAYREEEVKEVGEETEEEDEEVGAQASEAEEEEEVLHKSLSIEFTRYLYIKEEVLGSLAVSLIAKKYEESLFWAYELYHSGITENLFEYFGAVYREYYRTLNPKFEKFVEKQHLLWTQTHDPLIVATLVRNFVIRSTMRGGAISGSYKEPKMFVYVTDEAAIRPYETITLDCPSHLLKRACLYETVKASAALIPYSHTDTSVQDICAAYRFHWLYYASFVPLWEARIVEYGGARNETDCIIEFDDADKEEEFYDKYNYEPDEQSQDVQRKSIVLP